uniref:Uncharacterized protein n=1 Tax=Chromera velia CCMP2878 TaxID=1169474 RepID=A0A0G4F8B0_9ALVE|eukprot:Cvel_15527.t1-p1 / transcript=Cvel_15527.t1 / gene=Cvel_15527 / organism=Chromera_velia_CCMP2878 / gene_product=hypothetical protein / transcript_product=hypothetical protein / location=Cvel_scaffold1153:32384-32854(-) / protein_length=157 / sequence_SO=supercontig / SO=protein_coding / is_pseudo=false
MFPIPSQSRPQEVGGAAAHGPGVAGLEVRGRVKGDGNGEGVEAQKYSGIWAQTGRGGALQPFIIRQENNRSMQVNEFDQTPAGEAKVGGMRHNNINHRLVVSRFQWSEGQPFPSAPETANAAVSPVVSPEAVPAVIPPSASADAAAQLSGVNQEEEE